MSGVKITVDTGPEVDGADQSCSLSNKHAKKLSNILWDWYSSLPGEARVSMKTIHAFPDNGIHPSIRIEASLTGTYMRHSRVKSHQKRAWHCSLSWKISHRLEYQVDRLYTPDFCRGLPEKLTELLKEDLENEIEAFQEGQKGPQAVFESLKTYRHLKVA